MNEDRALIEFRAEITDDAAGTGGLRARIVPYGAPAPYGAGTVQFLRGGLTLPTEPVPLTVDHGPRSLDRIGVLEDFQEDDDGAYASFRFSDVPDAQTIRTLIRDGALTDVSIGVAEYATEGTGKARTMTGVLDHVSVVPQGRFGKSGAGSKALSVHDHTEETIVENETLPADAPDQTIVQTFDADGLRAEFQDTLGRELAEFGSSLDEIRRMLTDTGPARVPDNAWMAAVDAGIYRALGLDELAEHAIADVIGDLGAADASGIVPDWYYANGLQQNLDRRRPLFTAAGRAQFPEYGNNLLTAEVDQEVQVASGTAEKAEPASRALQASAVTFPVEAHKGVVDVSMELMRRSNPDVMAVLRNSYLRQYAISTNADLATKAAAAAANTGAALTTGTYAGLIGDIITQSNAIEDATGLPGDRLAVTGAQWIAILSLIDGGDRRQFAVNGPENADGSALLTARGIDVGGVVIFRDYSVTNAIQFNQASVRVAERAPEVMADRNLQAMGYDVGIFGETVAVLWGAGMAEYAA